LKNNQHGKTPTFSVWQADLMLAACALFWGLGFVGMKSALEVYPTYWLLFFRFTGGALLMGACFSKRIAAAARGDLAGGAVMGVFLFMGMGGHRGPDAVANILNGTVNPSGKLTSTWTNLYDNTVPAMAGAHYGRTSNMWATNPVFYFESNLMGYRWYDTMCDDEEVLDYVSYPFGFGLSYTKFEFSDLKLSKKTMGPKAGDSITATVTVKNVGTAAGKEVVQLYIGADTYKEEGRPIKELKYFEKTKLLAPGESQVITFTINNGRDLQYYDDAKGSAAGSTAPFNVPTNMGFMLDVETAGKYDIIFYYA